MPDEIRTRRPEDLDILADVLLEQQPASRYPLRSPLPFPAQEFIARPGELASWVALRDDSPVGHVSVQRPHGEPDVAVPGSGDLESLWSVALGRPVAQLAVVSALFTATSVRGSGLGGRLLDTAVAWIRGRGLCPCLDVLGGSTAEAVYRARGWQTVGEFRPDWLPADMPPMIAMVLSPAEHT